MHVFEYTLTSSVLMSTLHFFFGANPHYLLKMRAHFALQSSDNAITTKNNDYILHGICKSPISPFINLNTSLFNQMPEMIQPKRDINLPLASMNRLSLHFTQINLAQRK